MTLQQPDNFMIGKICFFLYFQNEPENIIAQGCSPKSSRERIWWIFGNIPYPIPNIFSKLSTSPIWLGGAQVHPEKHKVMWSDGSPFHSGMGDLKKYALDFFLDPIGDPSDVLFNHFQSPCFWTKTKRSLIVFPKQPCCFLYCCGLMLRSRKNGHLVQFGVMNWS